MQLHSGALCCNAAETWINTYELQRSCSNGKLLQYCAQSEMYLVHTEMTDAKLPARSTINECNCVTVR